jgi:hypothetical protein
VTDVITSEQVSMAGHGFEPVVGSRLPYPPAPKQSFKKRVQNRVLKD